MEQRWLLLILKEQFVQIDIIIIYAVLWNNESFIVPLLQIIKFIWINSNLIISYMCNRPQIVCIIPSSILLILKCFILRTHHQIISYAQTALWAKSTSFLKILQLLIIHEIRFTLPLLLRCFFQNLIFDKVSWVFKV